MFTLATRDEWLHIHGILLIIIIISYYLWWSLSNVLMSRKEADEEDLSKADDKNADKKEAEQKSSGEQTILYPHEVKHHLRQVWDNEKHVLRHVLHAFAVNAGSMDYPIDIFFKQVQPVMPTRYRPVCTYSSAFSDCIFSHFVDIFNT